MSDELTKDRFPLEVDSSDDEMQMADLLDDDTLDDEMLIDEIPDDDNDGFERISLDANLINDRLLNNDLIKEKLSKDQITEDEEEITGKLKFKKRKTDVLKTASPKEKPNLLDWWQVHLTRENIAKNRFHIIQVVAVVFLFVFIGCLLYDNVPDNVSLSTIEEKLENTDVFPGNMQEADSKRIRRLYGINKNDYSEILSYIPENSMDVDELLIVHVSDSAQIETVKEAMESRLSSQKTSFDGYGTNQTELLGEADIESRGNYVYFAVGKEHKSWIKTIQEALH